MWLACLLTVLSGSAAAFPGGAAAAPATEEMTAMPTLTDDDNGRTVAVHVGDVLAIRLAENASTGFRWAPDGFDAGLLKLDGTSASYPGAAVGSGGTAEFRFRVLHAGRGTLGLKYFRHWEGDASIARRFAITVDAVP